MFRYHYSRRDRIQVIADVVIAAQAQSVPTRIMSLANLDYSRFKHYTRGLLKLGYITETHDGYTATPPGIRWVKSVMNVYGEVKTLMRENQ